MKNIRTINHFKPVVPNGTTIVYMQGYGGRTWQAVRQINVLKHAGYKVIALDFKMILASHQPSDLIELMDEVDVYLRKNNLVSKDLIMVGISLGGLIGYNMIRRHKDLHKLIIITGGNIALLPSQRSLKNKWGVTRDELTDKWFDVNMHTTLGKLKNKNIIMLLPINDKVIDPSEVVEEIKLQSKYNDIQILRTKGGHIRTIINTTILKPKRILPMIHQLENR